MRKAEPTHLMRTFPADKEGPSRRQADALLLTGLPQPPVKWLVVNRLDLAMEAFERSLEPADDDDEDGVDTEADDEVGDDEDDADTDEHEHGGQA